MPGQLNSIPRLLIGAAEQTSYKGLESLLEDRGWTVKDVSSEDAITATVEKWQPDLILLETLLASLLPYDAR